MNDRLDPTPNRHEQGESRGGVIAMIDLDHFEAPNDTDGRDSTQATPRSVLRLRDTMARLDGDESIVMFDDLDEVELTKIFAPRRRSTTGRPWVRWFGRPNCHPNNQTVAVATVARRAALTSACPRPLSCEDDA